MMTIRFSVDLLLAMARDGEEFTFKDGRRIRIESNVPEDAQVSGGEYRHDLGQVLLFVDGEGEAEVLLHVDHPELDS